MVTEIPTGTTRTWPERIYHVCQNDQALVFILTKVRHCIHVVIQLAIECDISFLCEWLLSAETKQCNHISNTPFCSRLSLKVYTYSYWLPHTSSSDHEPKKYKAISEISSRWLGLTSSIDQCILLNFSSRSWVGFYEWHRVSSTTPFPEPKE